MNAQLQSVLQHPAVWRPGQQPQRHHAVLRSGIGVLDDSLPGGGWPVGAVTEILASGTGIGEVSLVLPAVARLSQQGRWVAWVAPPHLPYPPALQQAGVVLEQMLWLKPDSQADALWAAEQSLRSGTCGAVLAWLPDADHTALRRLQLAAEAGGSWCVILRDSDAATHATPAAVRVKVASDGLRRQVQLLKCRGGMVQYGPRAA